MKKESLKKGDLRIWHIPQVPGKAFRINVKSIEEAKLILPILWNYDIFQFDNHIKPDYCNVSGLEEFDGKEWIEWYNEEDGNDICQVLGGEYYAGQKY